MSSQETALRPTIAQNLEKRIADRTAKCAVIGLGYVGLPLSLEFAKSGYSAIGIDISEERVQSINNGQTGITDVTNTELQSYISNKKFIATTDYAVLKECDTINICVPTPLGKTREPDVSYILSALDQIIRYLKKGHLIILESTTYPGTTEEILQPAIEREGFKIGTDVFLVFSPERIDPSNPTYNTKNIPKIVGGVTPTCARLAKLLYSQTIDTVIEVSSPKAAEMVKLTENTFRSVNIGMVNELALMCNVLNIDVWEVIDAASTKPFGYMPFYPGPGLGGHCIPIDPVYLSWKSRLHGYEPHFIELAGTINQKMPDYCVGKIQDILNTQRLALNGAKILIIGMTYKPNVNDTRESPAIEVAHKLLQKGAHIEYVDPYVPKIQIDNRTFKGLTLTSTELSQFDMVVILTNHKNLNYKYIVDNAALIFDTRNALKNYSSPKITKL